MEMLTQHFLKDPKLKNASSSKAAIALIDGKVIAWIGGLDDKEIKRSDVEKITLVSEKVLVNNLSSGGRKAKYVNIYNITISGETYTMRLVTATAADILAKIQ